MSKPIAVLKRLSRSSFLHILIFLVVTDVVLSVYVPSKNLLWYERSISGSNEPFCRKIFEYICSRREPQVLMLGSSFLAVPSISCDQVYVKARQPYHCLPDMFTFSHYKHCDYFRMLVSDSLGKKVDVINLGIAGTVASDQLLILQKALQFDKKPALVVCTVAPTDFIWNDGHDTEHTRISLAFKSYTWPLGTSPLALAADQGRRELYWHFQLMQHELSSCRTILSDLCNHQLNRPQQKDLVASDGVRQIKNLSQKLPEAKMDAWGRKNTLEGLDGFRFSYSKLNMALFDEHISNFNKMLDLCKQHNIPIVVVNMPLTSCNRGLIAKPVYDKYYSSVKTMADEHQVPFMDMDEPNAYTLTDFYDSAHLNEVGGRKFFTELAQRLSKVNIASGKVGHLTL